MTKDLTKLKGRFCDKPFRDLIFYSAPNYEMRLCCWVFKEIGDFKSNENILETWNSPFAQEVRKSILEGKFEHCWDHCRHIGNDDLPKIEEITEPYLLDIIENKKTVLDYGPKSIQLNNDLSCNLSCPSCRTEKIMNVSGPDYLINSKITHQVLDMCLLDLEYLFITGSGDPFASKIYRDLLQKIDGSSFPKLKIRLFTNGVMFTEEAWKSLHLIHDNIDMVIVSLDAATEETYQKVRRGGHFLTVIDNLKMLSKLNQNRRFHHFEIAFVVQDTNFREMKKFVELGLEIGNCDIMFQRIWNWGTFSESEFLNKAIYEPTHPNYLEFIEILKDPIFKRPEVNLTNLNEFLNKV